ncbi:LytTR family two component transcriptional regulator [Aquimarina sp. MAR_2010_214]|uniref:LytR/AlgR family response regulator transcription factor n=1 Tax=Aquimarina sp. MAR_2010_214 TaxID=1250026 RepID=UPI000CAA1105|nr:LytTR family DNA-binding domain-containing protein [Aquimarina sp. MAR_2010_214]PKV49400.1 LytTR family two component transcriptional regulator [Aquimarina sp. MAR_2010_214]
MKVAIIEDEPLAAEKLERYLLKYDSDIQVIHKLPSIEEAVLWINVHQEEVDLFFMDVQLIDGLSFEIFNKVKVNKPVIFTTAFDEFAIDAFKVNSIDYLLKPILFTDLSKALKKLETLRSQFLGEVSVSHAVKNMANTSYKNRFLVRLGNHIHSVKSEDISFFFAEGRDAYLVAENRKKYMIEYKLETLEELLEPKSFFRVNRTFIVNINAIQDVLVYSNRRLKLTLNQNIDKEVIVSREKVTDFKQWFEGN